MLMTKARSILLTVALLLSLPMMADEEGRAFLAKANAEYEAGRFAQAVAFYKKAAEHDETEAMFLLGYAYSQGEGVAQDWASAAMWFKRAANDNHVKAAYNLAFCYMNGHGVPCDYEKALKWLLFSAQKGFAQAQLTLSECYEQGILVEQNIAESNKWKQVADNGTKTERKKMEVTLAEQPMEPDAAPISATQKKAPVVKILYPRDLSTFHTDLLKIKYQLIAGGLEKSTKVFAMVDGVKQQEGGDRAVKQANTLEVEVPKHDCTLTLYAQNEVGNSEPVSIRLIREQVAQADKPRLFCVVVGVGDYHDEKLPPLKLSTKDARDFAAVLSKKKQLPFADVQVKLLLDKEAARSDLFEAMEWLQQESTPNDICLFFYAGHGYRDEKDRYYFMPYGGSTDKLYNCFSARDFKSMAEDINCKFIVFADACYSAALLEGNRSAATEHFVEQLRRTKNGMLLYASSASDTKSKEDPAWGNGAFTKALISAFNGAAREQTDEGLSTQALEIYLYKEVRRITNFKQTPIFINPNGMEHFNLFTYEE